MAIREEILNSLCETLKNISEGFGYETTVKFVTRTPEQLAEKPDSYLPAICIEDISETTPIRIGNGFVVDTLVRLVCFAKSKESDYSMPNRLLADIRKVLTTWEHSNLRYARIRASDMSQWQQSSVLVIELTISYYYEHGEG